MGLKIRKCRLPAAALMAAAIIWGTKAQATIIFQTDFENPPYTTGLLAGQDGWLTFGTGAAVTVDNGAPIGGLQSAKITGALAAGQTGPFHNNPSAISKITVGADILLTNGAAERGWQFAAIGAGLAGFTGGIDIDPGSVGNIRALTNGFTVIGSFSRDTVHRVEILLDYGAQIYDVKLDGTTLASGLAFCGDNAGCSGAPAGPYNTMIFDTFGPTGDDSGYIDNILVESTPSVPEPATLALLLAGLLGAASIGRKRRSCQVRQDTC